MRFSDHKNCRVCLKEKSSLDFHKDASRKDGLRENCKECTSLYVKDVNARRKDKRRIEGVAYREANPNAAREYYDKNKASLQLARQKNAAIKKSYRHDAHVICWKVFNAPTEAQKKARKRETERLRYAKDPALNASKARAKIEKNIERHKLVSKSWRSANRDKLNNRQQRRNAAIIEATPIWANSRAMQEFYNSSAALSMHTGEWYEVDHIVPIQSNYVCGLHCEANLRIIAKVENRSKSNRYWPDMF